MLLVHAQIDDLVLRSLFPQDPQSFLHCVEFSILNVHLVSDTESSLEDGAGPVVFRVAAMAGASCYPMVACSSVGV